jgi:hypothetical protein
LWPTLNLPTVLVVNSPTVLAVNSSTVLVIKFPADLLVNLLAVLLVNLPYSYWYTTNAGDYFIRVSVVLAS